MAIRYVSRLLTSALAAGLALSAVGFGSPAASAPCPPGLGVLVGFNFEPHQPCPTQELKLWVGGCRECVTLHSIERIDSASVRVRCSAAEVCAPESCTAESLSVDLGRFPLGDHSVDVEILAQIGLANGDSCTSIEHRSLGFQVVQDCPPPTNMPYLSSIKIGPTPPCSGCSPGAICANVPIPVTLTGNLPSDCLYIKDVQVHYVRDTRQLPGPAIVNVIVGRDVCQIRQCIEYPIPWSRTVEMFGLPPGSYELPVRLEQVAVRCDGSTTSEGFWSTTEPFSVTDSCATPVDSCFVSMWDRSGSQGNCNAFVGPDRPANVTLQVSTQVALAGLQGKLSLWPEGLRITGLLPVGPAAGMRIGWHQTLDGAKFVMFAEHGAPIPPAPEGGFLVSPVLQVTVAASASVPIPPDTRLAAYELLGSNEVGGPVRECPIIYLREIIPIIDPAAHICAATPCDFNGDAATDVRDLVLMAHCVLESGYCPPDAAGHLDCNRNGQVSIDDVMCCAREFLLSHGVPDVPGRPEPGIRVSLLEPIAGATGVDLPVRLDGADRIGGARLEIRYPSDRFEVSSVDLAGGASNWLCLHEGSGDRLVLGLICLAPQAPGPLDLKLRLALRPGQTPGGDVRVEAGEFAGPDGAALEVPLGAPAWSFDGPPGLALSPGEPNPFTREILVQATLARPAPVEISVHDLSGRLVAVLHRGPLEAGSHPFTWKGTRADGSSAANGVYLLRARAGREVVTRKLVFLRGN